MAGAEVTTSTGVMVSGLARGLRRARPGMTVEGFAHPTPPSSFRGGALLRAEPGI